MAAQRVEKRTKQKILAQEGDKKTQKNLVHAKYCYEMNNSPACVKDPKEVTRMLKKFTSDAAKKRFLRSNIEMRVIGYGGEFLQFEITWSVKGKSRSVKELADHLRKIIRAEAKMDIPDQPPGTCIPENEFFLITAASGNQYIFYCSSLLATLPQVRVYLKTNFF